MEVTLLYFDGCPNWEATAERLRALAAARGFRLTFVEVESPEQARNLGFRGSPTILVDGRDPFAEGAERVGLTCRLYDTPEGLRGMPTHAQLEEILA